MQQVAITTIFTADITATKFKEDARRAYQTEERRQQELVNALTPRQTYMSDGLSSRTNTNCTSSLSAFGNSIDTNCHSY